MHFDTSVSLGTVIQLLTFIGIAVVFLTRRDDTLKSHTELIKAETEARKDQLREEIDARGKQYEIQMATIGALSKQVQELGLSIQRLLIIVESHEKRLDKGGI